MKAALDTNILVYAAGISDSARQSAALALIEALAVDAAVVAVQALGELFHVLTRKAGWREIVRATPCWHGAIVSKLRRLPRR